MSLESREGKIMGFRGGGAQIFTVHVLHFSSCWACGLHSKLGTAAGSSTSKVLAGSNLNTTGWQPWHSVCSQILFPALWRLALLQRMNAPASTCLTLAITVTGP